MLPSPLRTSVTGNQSSCQRNQFQEPLLSQPGRKDVCEAWDGYTSFFASKKLLRCRICQTPMATRMRVCRMDHHSTRWLVLSLVCRKRSSRHCGRAECKRSLSRLGCPWAARTAGFPSWRCPRASQLCSDSSTVSVNKDSKSHPIWELCHSHQLDDLREPIYSSKDCLLLSEKYRPPVALLWSLGERWFWYNPIRLCCPGALKWTCSESSAQVS